MITYQEMQKAESVEAFVGQAIEKHRASKEYEIAVTADTYDHQRNKTIYEYVETIYTLSGKRVEDFTASNNQIASNFFARLNTQRNMYSLGNGVAFANTDHYTGEDTTKKALGADFDHDIQDAAYDALIHGVAFLFWNYDHTVVFPLTQFAPVWDEFTGELRAGVRFWQLDNAHPIMAELFEEDGYTRLTQKARKKDDKKAPEFFIVDEKRPYQSTTAYVPADGVREVISGANYKSLPIIPVYASRLQQSTLVGMRQSIDSYDLIRSGFANDLTDCAEVYWLLENYGGMSDSDLERFRDRLKIFHVADVNTDDGGKVTPYTQEIPYDARTKFLEEMRAGIYEDFGGLDVHTIAAGATNDHIDAAYQPLDENAADFEYQISRAIKKLLALLDIEDTPIFNRLRISNQREQVETILLEAPYLDRETILRKFPNITPDEAQQILERVDAEDLRRFNTGAGATPAPGAFKE